jgi:hypothetical protein
MAQNSTNTLTPMIYHPLEGDWTLVRATNRNIRTLCAIMCATEGLSEAHRAAYAIEGELIQVKEGETEVSQPILYGKRKAWGAICEALFVDFPTVGKLTADGYEIIDEDVFENIDMAEARRAFDDFFLLFGVIPPELSVWSNLLTTRQDLMTKAVQSQAASSTERKSSDGGDE